MTEDKWTWDAGGYSGHNWKKGKEKVLVKYPETIELPTTLVYDLIESLDHASVVSKLYENTESWNIDDADKAVDTFNKLRVTFAKKLFDYVEQELNGEINRVLPHLYEDDK